VDGNLGVVEGPSPLAAARRELPPHVSSEVTNIHLWALVGVVFSS
jgi:hypothetical protein